jgi:hypothetical protein
MDDFDRIKLFLRDFLERFLKENEQISINNMTNASSPFTRSSWT